MKECWKTDRWYLFLGVIIRDSNLFLLLFLTENKDKVKIKETGFMWDIHKLISNITIEYDVLQ